MMRNPTRRNRNIGKTQGGRVKDGKANEKWSRIFTRSVWEQLSDDRPGGYVILTENPSADFYHPCSPAELDAVIARLPKRLTASLRAIVLRRISKPDLVRGVEARVRYRCIILNSFPKSNIVDWGLRSPTPRIKRHYEPWCSYWVQEGDRWLQIWTDEQAKHYYLYHLFLHELGHLNDRSLNAVSQRESFAEDFALTWARKLNAI